MKRTEAREMVFLTLFQLEFHDDFETRWPAQLAEFGVRGIQGEYASSTIESILANLASIDAIISSRLKGWTNDRLSKPVLAILRLGVYELCFSRHIPNVTAIDEAVRLSYLYCDEKESTFVNGLLNGLLKDDSVEKPYAER